MKKNRKAVIFDMGGVLVDLDIEGCRAAFKRLLGFEQIDQLVDPCHQKGAYGEMEEGLITADEFRNIILAGSRPDSDPSDVDRSVWHILVGIEPYKAELLKRMARSYDLYMLSNNNAISMAQATVMFTEAGIPLDRMFKEVFLSYKMRALKPSASFYKAVVEQIGLPAEDMLFIDDSQKNVDGSIAAGLPAVYYKPGTDLSALLADVLDDDTLKVEGVQ